MTRSDEAVIDRARALRSSARLLVKGSRQTREAARLAQQHSGDLLARLSRESLSREYDRSASSAAVSPGACSAMGRRRHDRVARPGRRHSDIRAPFAENRRVLLVGTDEAWRLLAAYVFEEAGYVVYAAAEQSEAVAFTRRLLPDVVVVQMATADMVNVLAELSTAPSTSDIPIVVLTASLVSPEAHRARRAGGVTLLPHTADVDVLVGEVDTLIATVPRAQRTLKRRLLSLQELARHYTPNAEGQARLRSLIDRLQVAILAVDEQGHCIAASAGATMLTGYSHRQLLTTSVFQAGFAGGQISDERWRHFLAGRQYAGTTTITNRAGEDVTVHAAALAEILPGFHVAAFTAA